MNYLATDNIISNGEVFFSGKKNIEGYAALISFFLPRLLTDSLHPGIINVDNDE